MANWAQIFLKRAWQPCLNWGLSCKLHFMEKPAPDCRPPTLNCLPVLYSCSLSWPYKEVSGTVFQPIGLRLSPSNSRFTVISLLASALNSMVSSMLTNQDSAFWTDQISRIQSSYLHDDPPVRVQVWGISLYISQLPSSLESILSLSILSLLELNHQRHLTRPEWGRAGQSCLAREGPLSRTTSPQGHLPALLFYSPVAS